MLRIILAVKSQHVEFLPELKIYGGILYQFVGFKFKNIIFNFYFILYIVK